MHKFCACCLKIADFFWWPLWTTLLYCTCSRPKNVFHVPKSFRITSKYKFASAKWMAGCLVFWLIEVGEVIWERKKVCLKLKNKSWRKSLFDNSQETDKEFMSSRVKKYPCSVFIMVATGTQYILGELKA